MRLFEFGSIDVLADLRRIMSEMGNEKRANLAEDIIADEEYASSFIASAVGSALAERDLIVGKYYFPMTFSFDYSKRSIAFLTVVQQVKYIGIAGSRFEFKYDTCDVPIQFPSDEYLSKNEYTTVYSDKDTLDQIISLIILKFKGNEWNIVAQGYNLLGSLQRITNI